MRQLLEGFNREEAGKKARALWLVLMLFVVSTTSSLPQTPPKSSDDKQNGQSNAPASPENEPAEQATQPRYQLLRSEEDWSFLKDKRKRTDYLDPIKYLRLRNNRDDWFLTLGGEIRPFYENFSNESFGVSPRDADGYLLQRLMFHANLRLGKNFRFFAEIKSGVEAGRVGGPRPPDKDNLNFNQAFAEFDFGFGDKNEADGNQSNAAPMREPKPPKFAVRLGRQELDYGSGRLVSVREGPNVRQAFDGARIIINAQKWRVDVFAVKPVDTPFGVFDDAVISSSSFWGVYAARPLTIFHKLLPKSNLDVYYLGVDSKRNRFDQGVGRDIRHTFGARAWNKEQSFDYDLEVAGQLGKFGRGDIRAAFFSFNTGYTFKKNKFQPRLGLAAGINSGDRDPNNPNLQTFSPPFPRGKYFGQIGANGPNNIAGFSPSVSFKLLKKVTVTADNYVFFRQSLNDGLYGVPGNLLRTGRNNRARFIGAQPQIEGVWQIDRHFSFIVNYALFFVGDFIKQTPPSRDVNYFATWITYKF